jgi:peptidoglycan/xylan/chitin deacetylase (PgdA/CDA1 family)
MRSTALCADASPHVILNFHGVGPTVRELDLGEEDVWLSCDDLAASLDAVRERRDVRITFDDGNLSDVTFALPALVSRGLTATFFVPAGRLGKPGFVDASCLRELVAAGMQVGSHGMHHRSWAGLPDHLLAEELPAARERLEDASGVCVDEAACPFGAYDRRSLRALRDAGFRRVYTSDRGYARPAAWLQPRNTMHREHCREEIEDLLDGPPGMITSLVSSARRTVKRWR